MKIKTTEEILTPYLIGENNDEIKFKAAKKAMKVYAEQFIHLAAEKVEEISCTETIKHSAIYNIPTSEDILNLKKQII